MNKTIKLQTHQETQSLFGARDENIKAVEKAFKVKITIRGEHLRISGTANNIKKAGDLIEYLLEAIRHSHAVIGSNDLYCMMKNFRQKKGSPIKTPDMMITQNIHKTKQIGPKTKGQREYVEAIIKHDIVFGIGPAGTGKTYLAMACAVEALKKEEVRRLILTRPAIEAGESLGYLPGDIYEKISPYLRPLYDALYDMMDAERIEKYL